MTKTSDRREAILQMAAAIGSVFTLGSLEANPTKVSSNDEIRLAAATSFQFATQRLLIPYGLRNGRLEIPGHIAAEIKQLSHLLDPTTAPPIYQNAIVESASQGIVIRFGDAISVTLDRQSIRLLENFLRIHTGYKRSPAMLSDVEIVEAVLIPFRNGSAFKYETLPGNLCVNF